VIEDDVPHFPDWSRSGGPDLFTLRAWLGAERALEQGQPLDDTVNFLQDRVSAIFGSDVFSRFSEFVRVQEADDLGAMLRDERRLQALLDHLLADDADDETPDAPDESYAWSAYEPGEGRRMLRRAVRDRRQKAAMALVLPRRGRVAGSRSGDRG
jgi:hypothetical protein